MDRLSATQQALQQMHQEYGSNRAICEALNLPQAFDSVVWAIQNDSYVSPAAMKRVQRALFPPPPRRKQPRPCPNAAQVALFNELGLDTWSEVIDAGLYEIALEQQNNRVREAMNAEG